MTEKQETSKNNNTYLVNCKQTKTAQDKKFCSWFLHRTTLRDRKSCATVEFLQNLETLIRTEGILYFTGGALHLTRNL